MIGRAASERRRTRGLSRWSSLVLALALGAGSGCGREARPAPVRVAAASDLTDAFEDMGRLFERETGRAVSFSFGSTGLLTEQIRHGAPFDAFAAASVSFADALVASGACDGSSVARARGRLAIWTRQPGAAPRDLRELSDARFARIAIAHPEHAPYGMAAREALVAAGVFGRVERRLVFGDNVRQALVLAETGNVEAAIVSHSLVAKRTDGARSLVSESLHRPIEQALVACRGGASFEGGRAFVELVDSPRGRAVMRGHGFALPGEVAGQAP